MNAPEQRLAGIVLAAGGSRRLGRPKQLVEWQGESLVRHAARQALAICDEAVVVVTGAVGDEIAAELAALDVRCIRNDHWEEGMGSSLRAGLSVLPEEATAALLMVCDQPSLEKSDLEALQAAWQRRPEWPAAAAYANTIGVPAIVPLGFRKELISFLTGDSGAGRWLRECGDVTRVEMPNAALDVDTQEDLRRLEAD